MGWGGWTRAQIPEIYGGLFWLSTLVGHFRRRERAPWLAEMGRGAKGKEGVPPAGMNANLWAWCAGGRVILRAVTQPSTLAITFAPSITGASRGMRRHLARLETAIWADLFMARHSIAVSSTRYMAALFYFCGCPRGHVCEPVGSAPEDAIFDVTGLRHPGGGSNYKSTGRPDSGRPLIESQPKPPRGQPHGAALDSAGAASCHSLDLPRGVSACRWQPRTTPAHPDTTGCRPGGGPPGMCAAADLRARGRRAARRAGPQGGMRVPAP